MQYKYIVIHHSLTYDGVTVDWQAIRNYHINTLHWQDIGYHFGIEKIKTQLYDTYEILVGRALNQPGAHTYGLNSQSIGICIVGNFDKDIPNQNQINLLINKLLKPLMLIFNIPISNIIGHREVYVLYKLNMFPKDYLKENIKSCPGFNFSMKSVRDILTKDESLSIGNKVLLDNLNQFDNEVIKQKKIFWQ